MLLSAWLMLSSLLYSLQLSTGSFPRPLTEDLMWTIFNMVL